MGERERERQRERARERGTDGGGWCGGERVGPGDTEITRCLKSQVVLNGCCNVLQFAAVCCSALVV